MHMIMILLFLAKISSTDYVDLKLPNNNDSEDDINTPIIIISTLELVIGVIATMIVLHFTRNLPTTFYTLGGVLNRDKEDNSFDLYLGKDAKNDIDKR